MSEESVAALAQKAIEKVKKSKNLPVISEGVVTSVDRDARTCEVEREDAPQLYDVRLNAFLESGNDVITVYPQKGSKVLCAIIEGDQADAYVLDCTDIEEISGQIGDVKVKMTAGGIVFNDGKLGGMVKGNELKKQLDKLTKRVDGIIQAIENGIAVPQDGGTSLQKTIVIGLKLLTDKEDFGQLENDKVKH